MDIALGINYVEGFDLKNDLHSIDVDDVAPPTITLSDVERHTSLLSKFLIIQIFKSWCQ